jgi:hypothetical protein
VIRSQGTAIEEHTNAWAGWNLKITNEKRRKVKHYQEEKKSDTARNTRAQRATFAAVGDGRSNGAYASYAVAGKKIDAARHASEDVRAMGDDRLIRMSADAMARTGD